MSDFVRRLTAIRRYYPMLRVSRFLHGEVEVAPGIFDIDWFDERGEHLKEGDWHNPEGRALVMRRVRRREDGALQAVSLLLNGGETPLTFTLPSPRLERKLVIDSAEPTAPEREVGDSVEVQDHAAVLIVGNERLD